MCEICRESTDIRDFASTYCAGSFALITADLSFIPLSLVLPCIKTLANDEIIVLFKPQFEVGKGKLNKRGVVKSDEDLLTSLKDFDCYLKAKKIGILGVTYSPILGNKEGNMEFLFYLEKEKRGCTIYISSTS